MHLAKRVIQCWKTFTCNVAVSVRKHQLILQLLTLLVSLVIIRTSHTKFSRVNRKHFCHYTKMFCWVGTQKVLTACTVLLALNNCIKLVYDKLC